MNNIIQTTSLLTAGLLFSALTAQAQLTWDPTISGGPAGGTGTWDTVTGNWWDGAINTIWDNSGATEAIIPDLAGNQVISVTTGVVVGDLTYADNEIMQLRGSVDNSILVLKSGGATWDTGGGQIEFLNNTTDDLSLSMSTGDTLTINGGGQFDTGEKPTGANWVAVDATLDVTAATIVRGNAGSVGVFKTVKLADGSRYIHERNGDQGYSNDWELGVGTVSFENRWQRNYTLNGVISGTGALKAVFMGNRTLLLANDLNSFSGGVEVSTSAILRADTAARLGDPANDITLSAGGILRLNGVDLGSTRDIILSGDGGSISNDSNPNTFGGKITGDGNLQIGDALLNTLSNKFTLTSDTSDYTGTTTIHNGTLELGIENALPTTTSVTIGGNASAATLALDGFNQTIGGLDSTGNNTKRIVNGSATAATLTINGGGTYGGQIGNVALPDTDDANNFSVVKTGAGTLVAIGATTIFNGGLTVTGGAYQIDSDNDLGAVPAAPTADSITLDGGTLQAHLTSAFEVDANRLITLGAAGGTIMTSTPSGAWSVFYNGVISGSGSLTKSAAQGLELGGANTYTGDTIITGGTFRLPGSLTSNVIVQSGTFVAGDFVTGTGSGSMNALTLEAGGQMTSLINSDSTEAGVAVVSGAVTIDPASTLTLGDRGTTVLTEGTKLTLIDYTSGSLTGTFAGLADGATVTVGSNNFTLDYDDDLVPNTVTLTAQEASGYSIWANTNSLTSGVNDGESDDPDFDGIENVLEYILGGDPLASDSAILPEGVINGANFELTFTRNDASEVDASASVEFGSDLTVFPVNSEVVPAASGTVGSVTFTIIENGTDADDVTASIPHGDATEFFGRVSGSLNP